MCALCSPGCNFHVFVFCALFLLPLCIDAIDWHVCIPIWYTLSHAFNLASVLFMLRTNLRNGQPTRTNQHTAHGHTSSCPDVSVVVWINKSGQPTRTNQHTTHGHTSYCPDESVVVWMCDWRWRPSNDYHMFCVRWFSHDLRMIIVYVLFECGMCLF